MKSAALLVKRYFDGKKTDFAKVRLDLSLHTPFAAKVLTRTRGISYGVTKTYAWAGQGKARAAGNALGSNMVPVIIPCHRVIRADGDPGGFAFGIARKKKLLALEKGMKSTTK